MEWVSPGGRWAAPTVEQSETVRVKPDELVQKVSAALATLLEKNGFPAATPHAPIGRPTSMPPGGSATTTAVGGDQLLLKDGTTIRGRIVQQTPGTFVTIETADGTQRTIPWDRVKEVVVGPTRIE